MISAPRFHDTMSPALSVVTTASTADSVIVRKRSSLSRRRSSRSATALAMRLKVAARSPSSSRRSVATPLPYWPTSIRRAASASWRTGRLTPRAIHAPPTMETNAAPANSTRSAP